MDGKTNLICKYNSAGGVACEGQKCGSCGWNPKEWNYRLGLIARDGLVDGRLVLKRRLRLEET